MRRGALAAAIAILDIAGYAVLGAIGLLASGPDEADPVSTLMFGGAVAAFSLMGALLIRRVPANGIGVLLLATGTAQTVGVGLLTYGSLGGAASPPWPGATIISAFGDLAYTTPFVIALVGIPLLFPDGRLPSPRFRWVVWVTVAGVVSQALVGLGSLIPGPADMDAIGDVFTAFSVGAMVFGLGGAVAAIWVRFRRGDPVQRQQVKWLVAVAAVAGIAFPLALVQGSSQSLLALASWVIGFLAFLSLPVAIALAVLRYRLYEIDRIVSRTIGYAVVTATMAVVFYGGVLLFEAVLTPLTGGNTAAIAASTLVVAASFQPLRRRIRIATDRRFDRSRYDAERTVAAFTAQMRDEVDLESLGAKTLEVVRLTVAPATVGLWIRRAEDT